MKIIMPTAEIIAIGTELLLGEITDTNTRDIAQFLKGLGIDLFRSTIVGDNVKRISKVIQEAMDRANIIFTTGGLGPTVDDPTRDAIAYALNTETVFIPELWHQIEDRFARFGRTATDNNKKQAYIPKGAVPIENDVGTAPAFYVEVDKKFIICLPGVPRELEYLLEQKVKPLLRSNFHLDSHIKTRILRVAGVGESLIDTWIGDLETNENPTVGLSAHPGQIDIRITAKAKSEYAAEKLLDQTERVLRERLGEHIFGVDQQTLEETIIKLLEENHLKLTLIMSGFSKQIANRFKGSKFSGFRIIEKSEQTVTSNDNNKNNFGTVHSQAHLVLSVSLTQGERIQELQIVIQTPSTEKRKLITYGGPPAHKEEWAINQVWDYLRRFLEDKK